MISSCSDLLEVLQHKEKLFGCNYIIVTAKVFPYVFFQHLKKVIGEKRNLKEWVSADYYNNDARLVSFEDNAFFYNPEKTIEDLSLGFGVEYFVVDEKNATILKDSFLSLKKEKNLFFLIFIEEKQIKGFAQEVVYKIDEKMTKSSRLLFEKYAQSHFEKKSYSLLLYMIDIIFEERSDYAFIEIFLSLLRHGLCIKKSDVRDFIISYLDHQIYPISLHYSVFDLVTLLFQGKKKDCLMLWKLLQCSYTREFWINFLMNQLWYAFLYVESKQSASEKTYDFFKKVNKWFFLYGEKKSPLFDKKKLQEAYLFLYNVDLNAKLHETDIFVGLHSFFLLCA
jgi:hypothetical protein